MIFDVVHDFATALAAMPEAHPRRRILALLDEAIRRDIHFIDRHPTTLFQCLWNSCWWYDCPQAKDEYVEPSGGWQEPAWAQAGAKLYVELDRWRCDKERQVPGFCWLRSRHPLPTPLGGPLRSVLRGHKDWISSVAFSANRRRVASGSRDRTVRVWDATSGDEIACLGGHEDLVRSLEFSADDRTLTVVTERERKTWTLDGGFHCMQSEELPPRNPNGYVSADSVDGSLVAESRVKSMAQTPLQGEEGYVRLRNQISGETRRCDGRHGSAVNALAFSCDGRLVASASGENEVLGMPADDCTVRIWDVASGAEIHRFGGHLAAVRKVRFSPDGRLLVSASVDATARVWDVRRGALLTCLHHPGEVGCLAFSNDSRWLATGAGDYASDNAIRLWEFADNLRADLELVEKHRGKIVAALGDRIITYQGEGLFVVRDSRSGERRCCIRGDANGFGSCAVSADGQLLALQGPPGSPSRSGDVGARLIGLGDGGILIVDVESGQVRSRLNGIGSNFAFFAGDKQLLTTALMSGSVRVWDVETSRELSHLEGLENTAAPGRDVAVAPDGRHIAGVLGMVDYDHRNRGRVCLWEAETGRVVRYVGAGREHSAVTFSGDGLRLATIAVDDERMFISVFETATGDERARIPLPFDGGWVSGLAFSGDGSAVACQRSGYMPNQSLAEQSPPAAWVYDVASAAPLRSTEGFVPLAEFAEGGPHLMAVQRGAETAIVSSRSGKTIATYPAVGVVVDVADREWMGGPPLDLGYVYRIKLEGEAPADEGQA